MSTELSWDKAFGRMEGDIEKMALHRIEKYLSGKDWVKRQLLLFC